MKRFIAMIVAMSLVFIACCSVTAKANDAAKEVNDELVTNNNPSKFHFYFDDEKYHNVNDKETCVEAFLYMKELYKRVVLNNELIQVYIEFGDDYTESSEYARKVEAHDHAKTKDEEIRTRNELTSSVRSYHKERNEENKKILSVLEYRQLDEIEYSPFVRLLMDVERIDIQKIIELAEDEKIKSISFAFEDKTAKTVAWDTMLDEINAADVISESVYTGEGVRIGILESGGICDIENKNLKDKDIIIRDASVEISDHATEVTSIVALMVPDATFLVSDVTDNIGLSWFIGNGCSIVNASFCYTGNIENTDHTYSISDHGYKTYIDGIYDYQIRACRITVVAAAGNLSTDNRNKAYNPQNNVRSPALAYNVITVGGIKKTWTLSGTLIQHDESASYVSGVPYIKPEVSAFYTVTIPAIGIRSGTSYAAPQVTACLAVMIDKFPNYFDRSPAGIKALLVANANQTDDYSSDCGNFDDRVGAGYIDLERMMSNWYRVKNCSVVSDSPSGTEVASYSIAPATGGQLQIVLTWYIYYETQGDTLGYLTDYDIRVYNSSGEIVASSTISAFSNIEMLRYDVEEDDTYRIVVYQYGSMNPQIPGETVHLAYSIS